MNTKRYWLGKHLMLKKWYAEKILKGEKVTTIRLGKVDVKSKEFFIHAGGKIIAKAVLESIQYKRLKELTDEDARMDGFENVEQLKAELKKFYPKIKEHDWVTIIKFRVIEPLDLEETHIYGGLSAVEIAKRALEKAETLGLSKEEKKILELLVKTESLRAVAKAVYGSLKGRKKIRRLLLRLKERLDIENNK